MRNSTAQHALRPALQRAVEIDGKKLDAVFAGVNQCQLPGAAAGIAVEGKPVYRQGFGLASMELPVVLTPSTRLRIGSTTKHFAALAFLLLCEDGKASIDDPIHKHLPELHASAREVTARHLMGNTSGLRDACDIKFHFSGIGGRQVSSDELVSLYCEMNDVNAAPGTAWIYNNGAWVLLSVAIERIIGQSLDQFLRLRIFEPVGMRDSLLRRSDTDFVPNSATPHMSSRLGGYVKGNYGLDLAGAGAIVSTIDDMLRWLHHMDAPCVGNEETWALLKTPQRLANGTSTGYGMGLFSGRYRGVDTLHHSGGWTGSNSQMLKVPAAGLDVVVLANREDVSAIDLANSVLDACLPNLDAIAEPPGPVATGTFRSSTTGRVGQLLDRNGKQIISIDGMDLPAEADGEATLRAAGAASCFKLSVKLNGDRQRPASIQLNDFGNVDVLDRAPPPQPNARPMIGAYRSESTSTIGTLCETPDGVRLRTTGRFGSAEFALTALAENIWLARSTGPREQYGGIVSFEAEGEILRFSNFLTRALRFRRCH